MTLQHPLPEAEANTHKLSNRFAKPGSLLRPSRSCTIRSRIKDPTLKNPAQHAQAVRSVTRQTSLPGTAHRKPEKP